MRQSTDLGYSWKVDCKARFPASSRQPVTKSEQDRESTARGKQEQTFADEAGMARIAATNKGESVF